MRRSVALVVIALAAAGCGGSHHASAPVVKGSDWHSVLNDWAANGRMTQTHSCGSVVVALGALRDFSGPRSTYTDIVRGLDRYAGTVCTRHPRLAGIAVGMTNGEVAAIAGVPRTPGPHCWLYPVTRQHDGRRVCFTDGRATVVQVSVHG